MSISRHMLRAGRQSTERRRVSEDDLHAMLDDINPLKHAGEGWFATEEYPLASDINDPYVRGEVGHEGSYYPGPDRRPVHRRKK